MFIFSTYGAVNHSSAVFFRASWCLALLLFDLTVITVCIFRQLIIIKVMVWLLKFHSKFAHLIPMCSQCGFVIWTMRKCSIGWSSSFAHPLPCLCWVTTITPTLSMEVIQVSFPIVQSLCSFIALSLHKMEAFLMETSFDLKVFKRIRYLAKKIKVLFV